MDRNWSHEVNKIQQNSNSTTFFKTQNKKYRLKLVDKMCEYNMGPPNVVEDKEQTLFHV